MEYVLMAILALLVVGGGITLLTLRATRGSTPASPESGDPTPVGDTPQHSDAPETTGSAPARQPDEPEGDRFKRDPIGGEAEAEPTTSEPGVPRAG